MWKPVSHVFAAVAICSTTTRQAGLPRYVYTLHIVAPSPLHRIPVKQTASSTLGTTANTRRSLVCEDPSVPQHSGKTARPDHVWRRVMALKYRWFTKSMFGTSIPQVYFDKIGSAPTIVVSQTAYLSSAKSIVTTTATQGVSKEYLVSPFQATAAPLTSQH